MNCTDARRLFAGCWDDELTQAERDWLERHLAACARCRAEYDELARTLELAGSLPRIEPDAELVERVLARTRRATVAPDRVTLARPMGAWFATAAAGLAIAGLLLAPWRPWMQARQVLPRPATVMAQLTPVREPELRHPVIAAHHAGAARPAASDSLFDHSEDVEMVLDPVVLHMHNGRASVVRSTTPAVHGEQAVISF